MVVFGCSLNELAVMHYKAVPAFLEKCFDYIIRNGLNLEGIFRISGDFAEASRVQSSIDATDDLVINENTNPFIVANIISRFFRAIPGHVLIDKRADQWFNIKTVDDAKRNFQKLPLINKAIFSRLVGLLSIVAKNSDSNKMTPLALSIVMSPNLIERDDLSAFLLPKEVLIIMIENYEEIFKGMSALDENGNFLPENEFTASIGDVCMEFFCKSSPVPLKLKPIEEENHYRLSRNFQIEPADFNTVMNDLFTFPTDNSVIVDSYVNI
ncbi:RhoGAP domain containing protein [Tritrichomonas foetus]|uniref:RhoGAP domain containing protein n=1 Tax=Tritrichomonas foetus TaxID=1144522 RepID=A0A1J4KUG0_9EUKA|nr:RhoGAP domain containing protein [Tritrichomonas foetus]|eukprot:OHT13133.1 RhoGAP domain containing protein [Tritrichomonas foetus]